MKPLESLRVMGRVVAYHPRIAKHVGGVNAAILLCQLIYWDDRAADQELGIYKTSEEWEEETGLSYREQATARTKLRELGLLTETSKRLQHRIYYKINHDAFNELIAQIHTDSTAIPQVPEAQSPNDENAFREDLNSRSPNIKITTEITTQKSVCDPPPNPSSAGACCQQMRAQGIAQTNPSHPTLLTLIQSGATPEEFGQAARTAVEKGKADFNYVLGIVKRQREEAAKLVLHQGRLPSKQESIEAHNRAVAATWLPPELREKNDAS